MADRSRRRDSLRRYPPLMGFAVAAVMAAFILPSSLNVPQTNPSQTLEFAPVPPTDEDAPPAAGNTSSLGLGSSPGQAGDADGGAGGVLPPPTSPDGTGAVPRTKRCVGNPPRQTEDPLSPPCVGYFAGDNFGATYQGVTSKEIRVLIYADSANKTPSDTGQEAEHEFQGQYVDLGAPPTREESTTIRNLRRYARYFNERFQTYGRFVHVWVYFAPVPSGDVTSTVRKADAADNYSTIKPFAVLTTELKYGFENDYTEAMAARGVLTFGTQTVQPLRFFRKYPTRIWSYRPALETRAALFSSYVCRQVIGRPVVDSGQGDNGKPRKLGFLHTTDKRRPDLLEMAKLIRRDIEKCGGRFDADATFPVAGYTFQVNQDDPGVYAQNNMATFQRAGITTIIWPGGYETEHSKAAGNMRYFPEVVVAGDDLMDANFNNTYQQQDFWEHAWVVTNQPRSTQDSDKPCYRAVVEADPDIGPNDRSWVCNKPNYEDLRQLFTGIQVAGPRLTPQSVDQGFHAIPAVPSSNAFVPACYYDSGDYSCIKDAVAERWSSTQVPPGSSTPGCWVMVDAGRRYLRGSWPAENIKARARDDDPCNNYDNTATFYGS